MCSLLGLDELDDLDEEDANESEWFNNPHFSPFGADDDLDEDDDELTMRRPSARQLMEEDDEFDDLDMQ